MDKFTTVSSVAAPLPLINIDTDMIIPKQFLKTIKRSGLGKNLFDEMRYNQSGDEIDDFVLNQEKYKNTIFLAGDNFGCGSSENMLLGYWILASKLLFQVLPTFSLIIALKMEFYQ